VSATGAASATVITAARGLETTSTFATTVKWVQPLPLLLA
jgi:hypothetical protein